MAQNLDKYRRQLYKVVRQNVPDFTQKDFDAQFTTKETFESFVNKLEKNKKKKEKGKTWNLITFSNLGTYYRTYACDMPWAKNLGYCGGNESNITLDQKTLESLIGNYVSNVKTDGEFKIFEDVSYDNPNQPFKLGISSYYLSYVSGTLDNPRMDGQNIVFDVSVDTSRDDISNKVKSLFPNLDLTGFKPTISFKKDGKSFTYDILGHKGTATKVKDSSSKGSTEKSDSTNKSDSNDKSDDKKPYKPHQTTIRSKTTDYNKIDEPNLIIKDCSDFPFGLGCKNKLIGDINQKLLGNRRQDTYTKLVQNYLDNMGFMKLDNKENLLTKEVYDKIMGLSENTEIIKKTVKKVLKEYINKKQ